MFDKWSNRFLTALNVSIVDRLANFTLKNVLVCNMFTNFVFSTNNFVNPPKKRTVKSWKILKSL
jgi:hypothetical protein